MYNTLYNLCQYDSQTPAITTNKHFIKPSNPIYGTNEFTMLFSEDNRDNIKPNYWGPPAWKFLESVAAGYNKNPTAFDKRKMRTYLEETAYALPCSSCRDNFNKELQTLTSDDLESPESLQFWLDDVQENIKKRNVKKEK